MTVDTGESTVYHAVSVAAKKMLSVQSPGCAGMERLGGGGGGAAGGGGARSRGDLDDLSHLPSMASLQQVSREVNRLMELQARARGAQQSEQLNCPHRIQLPDGEGGPDRHLRLRVAYQHSELTRSAVQPPPNKSVLDVPEWAPPGPRVKPPSPHKKDGFVQKAVKYLVKMGGGRGAETGLGPAPEEGPRRPPPCVMVPLRPPPAPAPSPAPHAPPS